MWIVRNWMAIAWVATAALAGYTGHTVTRWYYDAKIAKMERAALEAAAEASREKLQIAELYEKNAAELRQKNRRLNDLVEHDLKTYRTDCRVTTDGMQLLIQRVRAANGTGEPK